MKKHVTRREFMSDSAILVGGLAVARTSLAKASEPARRQILNFNENMEYRRLGKTGLMISAVCLGGHWKRIRAVLRSLPEGKGWLGAAGIEHPDFVKNRADVVSRCMDVGINYIDACAGGEVLSYSKALTGRRDKMYLGYSWYEKEPRFPEWRTTEKLTQSLDEGLQAAKLDYVDLWRITCHEPGGEHTFNESEAVVEALDKAKKAGKARFTGISSHDRRWLKMMIERYPDQIEVILTPYTADSHVVPEDSLFDAVKKQDVGVFGIKPFASNSLFRGDSSPDGPSVEDDNRLARLAVRYVLANPAITAPIPGLISMKQVDNMAKAVMERRELDPRETADLRQATREMWARLPENYQWLKEWKYV